jgi:hypothetical protein
MGDAGITGSLDAKSDCHRIRKNAGVSLSVLFWCIIFDRVVGHNQISVVFVPEYERVINIHGNDRIHITLSQAITRLTTKQS